MRRIRKLIIAVLVMCMILSNVALGFAADNNTSTEVVKAKALEVQEDYPEEFEIIEVTDYIEDTSGYKIEIELEKKVIKKGEKIKLYAKVLDDNSEDVDKKNILWTSSDEEIVEINGNNEAFGREIGKTTVRASLEENRSIYSEIEIEVGGYTDKYLQIETPCDSLMVGEEIQLKAYNEKSKLISNKDLIWKSLNEKIAKVNRKGIVTGLEVGEVTIKVLLEDDKSQSDTIVLKVLESNKVKVRIRVEGYEDTLVPESRIKVDNFNLTPYLGEPSGSSGTPSDGWGPERLKEPTVCHALVSALEEEGIDCEDNEEGLDLQDYGWSLYVAMVGGDREFDYRSTSGWLYQVEGWNPNYGCQDYKLDGGEEILWYFGAYGFDTIVTEIESDKTKVLIDEEVTVTLEGLKSSSKKGKKSNRKIENALIYVDGEEYEIDGEEIITDKNGRAKLKFQRPGKYKVSAERFDNKGIRDIVRPSPIDIEVKEPVPYDETSFDELWKLIKSPKSTEKEICDSIFDAIDSLIESSELFDREKDIRSIIEGFDELIRIIEYGKDRIETQSRIKKVQKESLKIYDLIGKYSKEFQNLSKEIYEVTLKEIVIYLELLKKIEDVPDTNLLLSELIKITSNINKNLSSFEENNLEKDLIILFEGFITDKYKVEVGSKDIKALDKKIVLDVYTDILLSNSNKMDEVIGLINKQMNLNSIDITRGLKKQLTIEILDENKTEFELSKGLMEDIFSKEINRLKLETSKASVYLNDDIIRESGDYDKLSLDIKSLENEDIPYNNINEIILRVDEEADPSLDIPLTLEIFFDGEKENGDNITVFSIKDKTTMENLGGIYKKDSQTVKFTINNGGRFIARDNKKAFKDLENLSRSKKEIESMAAKGIITGRSEEEFDPYDKISRAEIATLITRMIRCDMDSQNNLPFKDVPRDKWYYDSVKAAYESRYINGRSSEAFDPNGKITREEMAVVVSNILSKKLDEEINGDDKVKALEDKEDISGWARDAINKVINLGIIEATKDLRINPQEELTREQTSVILYRVYNILMNSI
ncbi:S-layer homology domain-containing protein [Wukongibacter sp. M2B1]|uniref:S-layer homology domain-containing protein n=1 Tax=Wukongibacter sp. M2B1 TaxID=3088895 RepID=UPI003D7BAE21